MTPDRRDMSEALRRGATGRCPACGTRRMFDGYLAVVATCSNCGDPLGEYRAADGPAFFTIGIVGLLLVPILGFGFVAFRPDPLMLALWVTLAVTLLTLVLLRIVKGVFVAYLWARDVRDAGA